MVCFRDLLLGDNLLCRYLMCIFPRIIRIHEDRGCEVLIHHAPLHLVNRMEILWGQDNEDNTLHWGWCGI